MLDAALLAATSSPSRARRRLVDPDKFYSQRRWDTRIDRDAIGSDEVYFFWLYGNLESKIQAMVLPQLSYAVEAN